MKQYFLLIFILFYFAKYSSATLVDGIVTLSWIPNQPVPVIDRFLSNNTRIQLKFLCRESSSNVSVTKELIRKKLYKLDSTVKDTSIVIRGRIGRVTDCLPLQSDTLVNSLIDDKDKESNPWQAYYEQLWKRMEQRTFVARQTDCDYSGSHLFIDEYSPIKPPEISFRKKSSNQRAKNVRRDADDKSSPLSNSLRSSTGTLLTWDDGYYLIEIDPPTITTSNANLVPDVDVIVSMKNSRGYYITADEYPTLVFYGVMCAIYALYAIAWFICCLFYWKELLKIQFWIGCVILIGMIEKSAFLVEYDTLNRNGYKVHYAIVAAEIFSCLKRTVSRILVLVVALGYGLVKPRLGTLKQKIVAMGIIYFSVAATEAMIRINTKNDEANNKVFLSRIPLAFTDAIIYYWIFTGLMETIKALRLKNNLVKLNVYRNFTTTILVAIVASLLFMIWSLKSHYFTACVTNWREFWIDDAFWHILFSSILLVIMLLLRPSNNNQRYASVPLLDPSDDENDDLNGDDEERGEATIFDSIKIRKSLNTDNRGAPKTRKQQQAFLNRESNVSGDGGSNETNSVEDALAWVENNIPTSFADQALQALDDNIDVVDAKLQRSKMQ